MKVNLLSTWINWILLFKLVNVKLWKNIQSMNKKEKVVMEVKSDRKILLWIMRTVPKIAKKVLEIKKENY